MEIFQIRDAAKDAMSLPTLLPVEERGAFKRLVGGFFTLFLGLAVLYYGNAYLENVAYRLQDRTVGPLLFGAAFSVLVHGSQVLLLLLAWILIGRGVGSYVGRLQFVVGFLISSAGIGLSWELLPMLSGRLHYTFPLDFFLFVCFVGLFQILTRQVENWLDTSAAMSLWVYSFQSLELLPAFPMDTQALSNLFYDMYSSSENLMVVRIAGMSLFLSFFSGALISTWLLTCYSVRLGQVRRFWENELDGRANDDGIREVSMVDMRNLVHDLRNPLAAIRGMAFMLHEGGEGNAGQTKEKAGIMLRAVVYMERMIGEILHEDQLRAMEVGAFFEGLEERVRPFPWGEYVSVAVASDAKGLSLALNEIRFTRALLNILDNAWRANQTTGTTNVALHVRSSAKFLEVEILDSGPGYIPQDSGQKSRSRQKSGWGSTGLGLAFARKVVLSHNGNLILARRPDGKNGTSVLISLPVL